MTRKPDWPGVMNRAARTGLGGEAEPTLVFEQSVGTIENQKSRVLPLGGTRRAVAPSPKEKGCVFRLLCVTLWLARSVES
jgi:hypothetical protein